jgi:putative tributyrin esterase
MALIKLNFESQYLNNNTEISIILPDKPRDQEPKKFYQSGRKYQVLWLLHGTYGDHSDWLRKSNIELYACEKDLIVVMPSALNSDYSNWDGFMMGYSMYDYLTEELMPMIYNWFPASAKREDNFIAGLSMGGFGTIKYAVNHPEKFAAAASLSAPPMNPRDRYGKPAKELDQRARNRLNNAGGLEAFIHSNDNTWDKLGELAGKDILPRLLFACGTKDFFYENYLTFKKYAEEIALQATFEELEGYGHEWRFWDITIQHALDFFGIHRQDAGNPF